MVDWFKQTKKIISVTIFSLFLVLTTSWFTPAFGMNVEPDNTCLYVQGRAVTNAVDTATVWANSAYNDVNNNVVNIRRNNWVPYRTWFGIYNQDRLNRTQVVLDNIKSKLNSANRLLVSCPTTPNPPCDEPGDIAATTVNQRGDVEMDVCPAFFNEPASNGFNTRVGTIIHEFSHAVANTDDEEYGVDDASNLAINNPNLAVNNADNYEYFTEDLY